MLRNIRNSISDRLPKFSVGYATARSAVSRYALPPGDLVNLNQIEWTDRRFLLDQSLRVGPIFKALAWDDFWVCIVGLPECRRFLHDHGSHLTPQTLTLQPLVPKGFLRQMKGETHRTYRKMLVRAIQPTMMANPVDEVHDSIQRFLEAFDETRSAETP